MDATIKDVTGVVLGIPVTGEAGVKRTLTITPAHGEPVTITLLGASVEALKFHKPI